jgi:septal ring factor EnvC (AmiA/AmiB activator)
MKAAFSSAFFVLITSSVSVLGQGSSMTDTDQLRAQMNSQQKLLEQQQARIQALESALAEQQRVLAKVLQSHANGAMPVPPWNTP